MGVVADMKEGQDRVKAMCELISSCSPDALCKVKRLVFCCAGRPFDEGLLYQTVRLNAEAADGTQAKEGVQKVKPWEASPIGFDVWPDVGIVEKKKKDKEMCRPRGRGIFPASASSDPHCALARRR